MSTLNENVEVEIVKQDWDARKQIGRIVSKIKDYQDKVRQIVAGYYSDFLPNCYDNMTLMKNGKTLEEDINKVVSMINHDSKWQISMTQEQIHQHHEEMSDAIIGYKTSYKIQTIHSLFEIIPRISDDYQKSISIMDQIKHLLDEESDPVFSKLECYQNIRLRYHEEYQILLNNLNKKFESLIQLNEKPFQNTKSITIKIKKNEDQLHQVIIALVKTRYNVHRLCKFLMNNIFEPIITRPVSLTCNEDDAGYATIQLSYKLKFSDDLRPNHKTIFQRMMETFYCLGHMNILISERQCIFSIIAKHIKGTMCKLLIEHCLQHDIPGTIDEMNESTMVSSIQEFNKFLTEMFFLDYEHDHVLDEYASKIELLFQKKFCTNIMATASDIIRKDLHDMILVEEHETQFANGSDMFSSCMVSKSTIELKKLLDKILSEISSAEKELSECLMKTIANILECYCIEAEKNHEKLLLKIPQQTAIYHNNCMYLSFWMQKNASKLVGNISFMLIGNALRDQSAKMFNIQLHNQRALLMESLKGFELRNGVVELGSEPQKSVRQCIRQLDLLKSVWQTVLPEHIYKNSIGGLVTIFCTDIIRRILSLEDITAEIGSGLVSVIDLVKERAPLLFKDPTDISIVVKNWMKLMQLHKILDSSLIEIIELWAEGKGPLTLNYTAEEIKHLIRALFQNTKHRQLCLGAVVQL